MSSSKYDRIGIDYNRTRRADPYLSERLFVHLKPKKDGKYLDLGCGTGNYTHALQQKGFAFTGIDPSEEMLGKARKLNPAIDWRQGMAEKTGLETDSFDGVIASLTIHHWEDLEKAFLEIHRVLKPSARIVIFTSTPQQMRGYWLNHYFPKMLADSMQQMPEYEVVANAMKYAGLEILQTEKYFVRPDLQDHFLYCGKENPALYFEESVRNGISSFADLANRNEVAKGLDQLEKDLETGEINAIRQSYWNANGDYLYVIGRSVL